MAMRRESSMDSDVKKDYDYGKVIFHEPSPEEDALKGIDAWINGLPIAWRKRKVSIGEYREVSIRYARASGSKTEYEKILDGSCGAVLYFFEFIDAIVVCKVDVVADCLRAKKFKVVPNPDGTTAACYIKLSDLGNCLITIM
jgi:hypothetical protein